MTETLFPLGDIPFPSLQRYWIGVVSRQHVLRGIAGGFAQVCHGKSSPLKRMQIGDKLVYYSPTESLNSKTPCKRFTALGTVIGEKVYQYDMGNGFIPYRRNIAYTLAQEASINPLLENLDFITNKRYWGYPFKRGCFEISKEDFAKIASAMGIETK
ncbi:EVE domain-containing protein [Acetobacteraceae bacterium ESL0709]|nr:EVE domain-containing protein [Acetobacteraceae bacterium ESL0697]MDF7679081.1 EVE domain-containing protein [Acetobacteraceae bacterium ESL0709]